MKPCPDCHSVLTKYNNDYRCEVCGEIFGKEFIEDNRSGDYLDKTNLSFEERCLS